MLTTLEKLIKWEKPNYLVYLAFSILVVLFNSNLHNRESGSQAVNVKMLSFAAVTGIFSYSLAWFLIKTYGDPEKGGLFSLCLLGSGIVVFLDTFFRAISPPFYSITLLMSVLTIIILPIKNPDSLN